jgi:hypothetical protein
LIDHRVGRRLENIDITHLTSIPSLDATIWPTQRRSTRAKNTTTRHQRISASQYNKDKLKSNPNTEES